MNAGRTLPISGLGAIPFDPAKAPERRSMEWRASGLSHGWKFQSFDAPGTGFWRTARGVRIWDLDSTEGNEPRGQSGGGSVVGNRSPMDHLTLSRPHRGLRLNVRSPSPLGSRWVRVERTATGGEPIPSFLWGPGFRVARHVGLVQWDAFFPSALVWGEITETYGGPNLLRGIQWQKVIRAKHGLPELLRQVVANVSAQFDLLRRDSQILDWFSTFRRVLRRSGRVFVPTSGIISVDL